MKTLLCTGAIAIVLRSVSASSSCCYRLQTAFAGKIFYPDSPQYEAFDERWSNTSQLSPTCIVRPTTAEDVSTAIKLLTGSGKPRNYGNGGHGYGGNGYGHHGYGNHGYGNHSGDGACQFAIKAGGHNPNPGANDIHSGVSLDLSWLNDTTLSPDGKSVHLGTGARWQLAYDNIPGVIFPGGLCGGTGVGGVSLGGGMALWLPKVGWVANSVLNYEVVLANGDIIHVNARRNRDLFKALKGGGNNFGVVTHIKLALTEGNGTIYAGQVIWPAYENVTRTVLSDITTFTKENNQDQAGALQSAFLYNHDGTAVVDNLVAHTDAQPGAPILQPFLDIQPQLFNDVRIANMSAIAYEANLVQPDGYRDLTATVTFKNDEATMFAVHNVTNAIYAQIRDSVPDMDYIWFYIPLPWVAIEESSKRGGNVLGLERQKRDRMTVSLNPRWLDPAYDDYMYAVARQWSQQVDAVINSLGTSDPFLYMNYAGPFQNPIAGYGSDNVAFLKQVAAKYDPTGVFQRLVPGGFKLSNVA